ncbi:MAG TPA: cytochrome c3 family protein [Phycisphaerae bacterium]|nr:cytochrome c3 family protein [Phycisphaerae bacterium]HNU45304.1 cytochrome c3 family protein [Phycisphaerae bacterium]
MRRLPWLVVLAVGVVLGCSAAGRDRLKHFFFEIEPEPAATQATPPEAGPEVLPDADEPPPAAPGAVYASVHAPVRDRNCAACHDVLNRMQARPLVEACKECHARYFEEATHGPVADKECGTCHLPHRSGFPALQKDTVEKLCAECHDAREDLSKEAHADPAAAECSRCHDPHFGEAPFLKPGAQKKS